MCGGFVAAVGYGTVKAGSKLLGTGVKACFLTGTLILTAGGLKKIEDIQAGDRVYARDVESKEEGEKEVLRTFKREVDVLVHLWIDGEEIVTTQTHPFYVDGKGGTDAGKLTEQDNVLAYGERKLRVEGIWIEKLSEPVKVYNFEVEEYHTYYVGEAEVLVHNDNCGQGNGKRPANMSPEGAGRKGAFREAKRQNGVPVSEQPNAVRPNINKQNKRVPGKQYKFSNGTIIRDDVSGHTYLDDPTQNRGPHFNDEQGNHYDY